MNDPQRVSPPHVSPPHVSPSEARSGIKLGVMRYVLGISLAAVIVAFMVAFFVV